MKGWKSEAVSWIEALKGRWNNQIICNVAIQSQVVFIVFLLFIFGQGIYGPTENKVIIWRMIFRDNEKAKSDNLQAALPKYSKW